MKHLNCLMKIFIIVLISGSMYSCGARSDNQANEAPETASESPFQQLISNLKELEPGYTYDLVKQDAEGCYTPDKNGDSLFYNPAFPILGRISNDSIHSIIHLEPGDDLNPVLRTFNNEGKQLDEAVIVFGYCAGESCDYDECSEKITIVDPVTIEDVVTMVITPCDEEGNKKDVPPQTDTMKMRITVNGAGRLTIQQQK